RKPWPSPTRAGAVRHLGGTMTNWPDTRAQVHDAREQGTEKYITSADRHRAHDVIRDQRQRAALAAKQGDLITLKQIRSADAKPIVRADGAELHVHAEEEWRGLFEQARSAADKKANARAARERRKLVEDIARALRR